MKNPKKPEKDADEPKPVRSLTAVRGEYFNQLPRGTNLVILDPALAPHFPDSESVNRALHAFLAINKQVRSVGKRTLARRPPASSTAPLAARVAVRTKAANA